MKREVLTLIPARAGSKGVPGKNKRLVAGKPLISYSIEAALAALSPTRIVVSSDDADILGLARDAGVLGLPRPVELAQDATPILPVVSHVLEHLRAAENREFDCIVLLQPTAPLRTPQDIDAAVDLFYEHGHKPVCSVCQCEDNHPARMYEVRGHDLVPLIPQWATARRQDLPPIYHRNGALYVFGPRQVAEGAIITEGMTPYVMPASRSINIDVPLDLVVLDAVLSGRGT